MSDKKSGRHSTEFISIDTRKCQACWECVDACPKGVIGKLKILFHKHARIVNGEKCQGCLVCMKTCPEQAISKANH